MSLSTKSGWGMQAAFLPVTTSIAGPVNAVIRNVGVAISVVAGNVNPIRATKLSWRVDLAPDQPVGTVNAPTRWRVVLVSGIIPADISAYQAQAYPTGAHPELPLNTSATSPNPILYDLWLDFAAGDPGLNRLVSEDWADFGPQVNAGDTINAIICPIIDANLGQTLLGACSAQITLALSGGGFQAAAGASGSTSGNASLPRYDVARR